MVTWRIPGAAASPAKVASIGGRSLDEVVCKRITKTGSLVSHSRLCLTRREGDRYAEENQDRYGEVQGRFGASLPSNSALNEPICADSACSDIFLTGPVKWTAS